MFAFIEVDDGCEGVGLAPTKEGFAGINGNPKGETNKYEDEQPLHPLTISSPPPVLHLVPDVTGEQGHDRPDDEC